MKKSKQNTRLDQFLDGKLTNCFLNKITAKTTLFVKNDFLSGAFGVVTRASKDGTEFAIKTLKCVRLQEIG